MTQTTSIGPQSTMREVLEVYPGAQRALFRRYHIGGCSSCGFRLDETLAQVCNRNFDLNPNEVLDHVQSAHNEDTKLLISPTALAELLRGPNPPRLLDVRSREEHEAVHIAGSILLSNTVMQEALNQWSRDELFVVYDHEGRQALDAAAYFLGHGFKQLRCLKGGVDAWSQTVDPTLPRYRLE